MTRAIGTDAKIGRTETRETERATALARTVDGTLRREHPLIPGDLR